MTMRHNVIDKTHSILDMLKHTTHNEVVSSILEDIDLNKFIVKHEKLFTIIVPIDSFNDNKPRPMLCVHTDTVPKIPTDQTMLIDDTNTVIGVGQGIGADDRAGCWIAKQLIKDGDTRFVYGIFDEEEVGCNGSRACSSNAWFTSHVINAEFSRVSCFIGLDRRGGDEIAYYGCDSPEFKEAINDTIIGKEVMGSITDASELASNASISCCNLSVGYYNEHTSRETLKIGEMEGTLQLLREADMSKLSTKVFDCEEYDGWWGDADDWYNEMPAYTTKNQYITNFMPVLCEGCGVGGQLYVIPGDGNYCEDCATMIGQMKEGL